MLAAAAAAVAVANPARNTTLHDRYIARQNKRQQLNIELLPTPKPPPAPAPSPCIAHDDDDDLANRADDDDASKFGHRNGATDLNACSNKCEVEACSANWLWETAAPHAGAVCAGDQLKCDRYTPLKPPAFETDWVFVWSTGHSGTTTLGKHVLGGMKCPIDNRNVRPQTTTKPFHPAPAFFYSLLPTPVASRVCQSVYL